MRKYFDKYNREYFDNLDNNDELDGVNEQKCNAYWGAISDVLKQNDPEKVKAFLSNLEELSDVEWEIINQRSGLNVTPEQLDIFEDFSAFNEMAERYVNPYWGDGWMSEDVCEALDKAGYGEYIDKITEYESKKVDTSKKVIKEDGDYKYADLTKRWDIDHIEKIKDLIGFAANKNPSLPKKPSVAQMKKVLSDKTFDNLYVKSEKSKSAQDRNKMYERIA
jgi:hypothetical protein